MGYIKYFIFNYGLLAFVATIAVVLIIIGVKSRQNAIKHIVYNSAAILIALSIYEIYLLATVEKRAFSYYEGTFTNTPEYWNGDGVRWFGPADSSFQIESKKIFDFNKEIYDVKYTIKDGIRLTPGSCDTSMQYAIFLGCSFTYGEGVNDSETLPYFFNELSGYRYHTQNYGFHGYGPHHALFITENEIIPALKGVDRGSIVIYSLIEDHFGRAAGYKNWDKYGPKYSIDGDSLVFDGKFHEKRGFVVESLWKIWEGTQLFKRHFSKKTIKSGDIERVLLMIKRIKADFERFGFRFVLLINDSTEDSKFSADFYSELSSLKIDYLSTSVILPGVDNHNPLYFLQNDGHPTAKYNREVAHFLVKELLDIDRN